MAPQKQNGALVLIVMLPAFIGMALSACDSSEVFEPPVDRGGIVIDITPDDIEAPWELLTPAGGTLTGAGDSFLEDQTPGDYDIIYGSVDGYGTPGPESRTLEAGGTARFERTYIARSAATGTVIVDADPDELDAGWKLVTPDASIREGTGDSILDKLAVGDYAIWWAPEEGWRSPPGIFTVASLVAEDTLEFVGTYEPLEGPQGTIIVRPLPEELDAEWVLSGPSRFTASRSGFERLPGRETGEYSIEWQPVPGYRTPETSTGNLAADDSLLFEATYEMAFGSVVIDVTPDGINAPWTLSNENGYSRSGSGDAELSNVQVGQYSLAWGLVEGWLEPALNPVDLVVVDGQTATVDGQYREPPPAVGTIVVRVSPNQASWTLAGPGLNEARTGDARFEGVAPGEYEIQWLDLSGYVTPAPSLQTRTLAESETVVFGVDYALPGDPTISALTTQGAHGSTVIIEGANFGSHNLNIEWTGDRIESATVGVNPDTWPDWIHRYPNQGSTDHITTERAWSGAKAMDLTVDQVEHCNGGACESTLSYVTGIFDKIYISYWFNLDALSSPPAASKHLWVTCNDCGSNVPFGTVRNSINHTGTLEADGTNSKWGGGPVSLLRCSDNEYPQFWEPFKNAEGVGYSRDAGPSLWWTKAWRGATEVLPVYAWEENTWVRLEYYYDLGDWDQYNGEIRMATLRPNQGLYIGKWNEKVLMKSNKPGCSEPVTQAELVGFYLFTDNPNNDAHTKYWIDDVYIQTGTRSRVEIGDAPNYGDCTLLEVQPPTSWTNNRIEVALNYGGGFASGDTAYVFVINDNEWDHGNRDAYGNGEYNFSGISTGKPITLGQSQ